MEDDSKSPFTLEDAMRAVKVTTEKIGGHEVQVLSVDHSKLTEEQERWLQERARQRAGE